MCQIVDDVISVHLVLSSLHQLSTTDSDNPKRKPRGKWLCRGRVVAVRSIRRSRLCLGTSAANQSVTTANRGLSLIVIAASLSVWRTVFDCGPAHIHTHAATKAVITSVSESQLVRGSCFQDALPPRHFSTRPVQASKISSRVQLVLQSVTTHQHKTLDPNQSCFILQVLVFPYGSM